jgi:hypothetical protein
MEVMAVKNDYAFLNLKNWFKFAFLELISVSTLAFWFSIFFADNYW